MFYVSLRYVKESFDPIVNIVGIGLLKNVHDSLTLTPCLGIKMILSIEFALLKI